MALFFRIFTCLEALIYARRTLTWENFPLKLCLRFNAGKPLEVMTIKQIDIYDMVRIFTL